MIIPDPLCIKGISRPHALSLSPGLDPSARNADKHIKHTSDEGQAKAEDG